jgi:hypothetical protein
MSKVNNSTIVFTLHEALHKVLPRETPGGVPRLWDT